MLDVANVVMFDRESERATEKSKPLTREVHGG